MFEFDPSQQRVLALDPGRHARVVGAPGSGKTRVLVEAVARTLDRPGWAEEDVLVLAPNRTVSAQLRAAIERRLGRARGGTPVRTAASLGFALLSRVTAVEGANAPRLLTGTVQDEAIAAVVAEIGRGGAAASGGLVPEVMASGTYRAELRELWRVADDFGLDPARLAEELGEVRAQAVSQAHTRAPAPELLDRWQQSLSVIAAVSAGLARERPDECSSSALLRRAAAAVERMGATGAARAGSVTDDGAALRLPRLILVDDAQELGEGELALLAACTRAGSRVWVFGDPDLATGAFHGERTRALTRLHDELERRGGVAGAPDLAGASGIAEGEQVVALDRVHRHDGVLRTFIRSLTARIGAGDGAAHRAADASSAADAAASRGLPSEHAPVQFAVAASPAEHIGILAHRFRARRLGVGGAVPLAWSEMAVVCRTRAEANRVARLLASHQVPTRIAAGGLVLREHQIVRELIRLLQHALGLQPLVPGEVLSLAGGVIGGLDPVAIRRLRSALLLQARRDAHGDGGDAHGGGRGVASIDEIVAEAFALPGDTPVVDSAGGRVLRRLGIIAAEGRATHTAGGTAREVLWALWDATRLADGWQTDALEGRGARSDEAHRSLDAVLGLFFALQRHEEQDSDQPIAALLEDLLQSAVPEDTLAQRSEREVVTVTTPQGVIGREFELVAVIGAQDGSWPNLRARGSLLGAAALERWLRGGEALAPSRRDTIHDELRLFVHSCARARSELLVVAVGDEDHHPSAFFRFGEEYACAGLPSARLTLRGAAAQMRRRITGDTADAAAMRSLVALADAGIPGAHPDEWYGVLPASTDAPLVDLDGDPDARVSVSPSQLERAEACPLDWVIASLGGGSGSVQASLGTLVHHALETATEPDAAAMLAAIDAEWAKLPFDAEWESERAHRLAEAMASGLAEYLRDFESSDRRLLGQEAEFRIPIGQAVLRGMADRLEQRLASDGTPEVTVVDLKTGRTPPTSAETAAHAQLQAYQLGVVTGAFAEATPTTEQAGTDSGALDAARSGGARLLYVHPDATRGGGYVERGQEPISEETRAELEQRVQRIARVMSASDFTARVEHHCSDPHTPGNCRVHIIPAVSRA
ncbi:PD-(D/E)XK nuclease family protein [Leucobacter rhizosphaerae]|uniref:DNA 3'-5' helicase n=1 Tax=Leucobacter rhizosphaerae TaxID=2932245 RepID=A0ABY4FWG0_9MICO|nr:UrvD/REP family ATP-dependent DNA helicase [Leucobacter rhizosphaerae]UOQ60628.1 PD-(D/E)XK nuclease family protein [Leucobacter rhizosphaerae]